MLFCQEQLKWSILHLKFFDFFGLYVRVRFIEPNHINLDN